MWELIDRIVRNWKTSGAAVIAGFILFAQYRGWIISIEEIAIWTAFIEAIILLFAKDK